jgi:hypothetical protein
VYLNENNLPDPKGAAIVFLTTEPIVSDSSCEDENDYEDLPGCVKIRIPAGSRH